MAMITSKYDSRCVCGARTKAGDRVNYKSGIVGCAACNFEGSGAQPAPRAAAPLVTLLNCSEDCRFAGLGLIFLAWRCNGARTRDAVGFSKYDVETGKDLAARLARGEGLSGRAWDLILKIGARYARQLGTIDKASDRFWDWLTSQDSGDRGAPVCAAARLSRIFLARQAEILSAARQDLSGDTLRDLTPIGAVYQACDAQILPPVDVSTVDALIRTCEAAQLVN